MKFFKCVCVCVYKSYSNLDQLLPSNSNLSIECSLQNVLVLQLEKMETVNF